MRKTRFEAILSKLYPQSYQSYNDSVTEATSHVNSKVPRYMSLFEEFREKEIQCADARYVMDIDEEIDEIAEGNPFDRRMLTLYKQRNITYADRIARNTRIGEEMEKQWALEEEAEEEEERVKTEREAQEEATVTTMKGKKKRERGNKKGLSSVAQVQQQEEPMELELLGSDPIPFNLVPFKYKELPAYGDDPKNFDPEEDQGILLYTDPDTNKTYARGLINIPKDPLEEHRSYVGKVIKSKYDREVRRK